MDEQAERQKYEKIRTENVLKQVREEIKQANNQIEELNDFSQKWDDALEVLAQNMSKGAAGELQNYNDTVNAEPQCEPSRLLPAEAAQILKDRKKITIMTGAGISAASGIPTFRGQDGFWKDAKHYAGETKPEQICTTEFFRQNPMAVWEWHYDFIKLVSTKSVNAGHTAIAKFQEFCAQTPGVESILVTQNIDDLHTSQIKASEILMNTADPYCELTDSNRVAFTPHIYEIHGNVYYMHCSDETQEHSRVMKRGPTLQEFDQAYEQQAEKTFVNENGVTQNFCHVPICEECGAPMTPHCMFFDESYSEHYYRAQTVENFVDASDCLIVIGTALQTSMANIIVQKFLQKDLPVIEVNIETSINRGNNIQVLGKSEIVLPALFNEYYKLKMPAKQPAKLPLKAGVKAPVKKVSPKRSTSRKGNR